MRLYFYFSVIFLVISTQAISQTTIFPYASAWKYLDNGTNQGTEWRASSFNDAGWKTGNGQLGYGDGDEATTVSYGTNTNNKYITTYFRRKFTIANRDAYSSYTINVKRDDGVVIYLNGFEVYRNNLPTGTINYNTAATTAASDDGNTPQTFTLAPSGFISGINTIAVEIHQNAVTSSDISFDMQVLATPAPSTLITYGSNWKYLDNGTNQGTGWRASSFTDAGWKTGNAHFGYGDGDETTIVSYGPNASNKYITTYFRKTISVPDTTIFSAYQLDIKRDDGAVVYINGVEVYRTNMPSGTIIYSTLALAAPNDDGNTPQTTTLPVSKIKKGTNVIAVEIHQFSATSNPDMSFDLQLKGISSGAPVTLTRGPYLNLATQSGIIIRWKTNVATNSKVSFGTTAGNLTNSIINNTVTTDHVVQLSGLTVNTKYFYSVGSTTKALQGDGNNYFKTIPQTGSLQKIRILAMGDMGNNSTNQINVRNAYLNYNGTNYTDIWMLLGDNAYNNGTETEYQTNFFNIYQGNLTKNHVLWPAPGNHDYAGSSARQADHLIPYYDIFSLPKNAEAGGIASNNEAFYSYNYGNIHFVSLDSYGWETGNTRLYDTTGPQVAWLKQDLAANKQKWTVIYFHHPPYTKGSHNSDTETELINMRQNLVRILERYKVDLVLNGHSHSYERSYLMNGHYDVESTFNSSTHALSTSSAKYNGSSNSCPYLKYPTEVRNGIVFAIVGSAGQLGGTTTGYPHNSMHYSNVTNGGSMVIEIENNRLDARWVCSDGVIRDNFTIMKEVNKTNNITVVAGSATTLTASWPGSYLWSTGQTTRSITVSPSSNTTYTVTDNFNCLTDKFNVAVSSQSVMAGVFGKSHDKEIKVYPTLLKRGSLLNISNNTVKPTQGVIYDAAGKLVKRFTFTNDAQISTSDLQAGIYRISFMGRDKTYYSRFVVAE